MSTLKLRTDEHMLTVVEKPAISAGGNNIDRIEVEFDSSWDSFSKTAIFTDETNKSSYSVFAGNTAIVPTAILKNEGEITIGIFGINALSQMTSGLVRYNVKAGKIIEEVIPSPGDSVFRQLMNAYAVVEQQLRDAYADIEKKASIDDTTMSSKKTYSSTKVESLIANSNYKKASLKETITEGMNGGTVSIYQLANVVLMRFSKCALTSPATDKTWLTYTSEIAETMYDVSQAISGATITIAAGTREVKVTSTGGVISGMLTFLVTATDDYTDLTISDIQNSISEISASVDGINKKLDDELNLGLFVENEYVDYKGIFKTFPEWHRTGYVELADASKVNIICDDTNVGNSRFNAFYDEEKNFISRAYYGINTVPGDARYVSLSCKSSANISCKKTTEDIEIVELNRDIQNALIQSTAKKKADEKEVLTIMHITDIHGRQDLFNRLVEFSNYYYSNINMLLHTGDYVYKGQEDFVDLMSNAEINNVLFYNVVGNHDQYVSNADRSQAGKALTYEKVIGGTTRAWQGLGVTYMSGDYSMTYYKDFSDSKIRIIILDDYYNIPEQAEWLKDVLEQARTNGYQVITAKHSKSDNISTRISCFNSKDTYTGKYNTTFENVIKEFIDAGGVHICNLCGHEHIDEVGYTANGILNIVAECVTDDVYWQNCKRNKGTKTYDCFNIISIDTNQGHLKIVRVGDNTDIYMRKKQYTCIDYINKTVIA